MHINLGDDDFLVTNLEAEYWTGADWFHHPELSLDMTLLDASKHAIQTNGSAILFSAMMIEVDHDTYMGKHCIWVDYPDYTYDRYMEAPSAIKAIANWIKKCPEPNA